MQRIASLTQRRNEGQNHTAPQDAVRPWVEGAHAQAGRSKPAEGGREEATQVSPTLQGGQKRTTQTNALR